MRLAIVHDWLKNISGAERVLIELHRIFPDAPIYTLFYDKKFVDRWLPDADIRASFLQKIPFISKTYVLFGWLMPTAVESFDLSEFEKVLSSSAVFSKGLILKPSTKHICYCYSPTRMLWDWHAEYAKGKELSIFGILYQHFLRLWDRASADRVDQFVAISQVVQSRIKKYYRKDSVVIYPGIASLEQGGAIGSRRAENERKIQQDFDASPRGLSSRFSSQDYYLIVSRLHAYKNIDIAIEAFNKLNFPLVVIGDGPDRKRLEHMAGPRVTFLGEQDDSAVAEAYAHCRAFIMPQEEDFGLTPIEAMSFGKPVVALRKGGATETLREGQTGEFFDDPIPEALADAVRRLNNNYSNYNSEIIKNQASLFSAHRFEKEIKELVEA
ncbi:MAG: glycosyltransferase [Candidatus Pacebacteria bacterium]|nr:glycosyltransferase [Candidatus Paceibacterota bacterium]